MQNKPMDAVRVLGALVALVNRMVKLEAREGFGCRANSWSEWSDSYDKLVELASHRDTATIIIEAERLASKSERIDFFGAAKILVERGERLAFEAELEDETQRMQADAEIKRAAGQHSV